MEVVVPERSAYSEVPLTLIRLGGAYWIHYMLSWGPFFNPSRMLYVVFLNALQGSAEWRKPLESGRALCARNREKKKNKKKRN